jgi:hypothetical protein
LLYQRSFQNYWEGNYYNENSFLKPILALRVVRVTTLKTIGGGNQHAIYFKILLSWIFLRPVYNIGNLYQRRIEFYVVFIVWILGSRKGVCILYFPKIQIKVLYFSPIIKFQFWTLYCIHSYQCYNETFVPMNRCYVRIFYVWTNSLLFQQFQRLRNKIFPILNFKKCARLIITFSLTKHLLDAYEAYKHKITTLWVLSILPFILMETFTYS